ncbi:unnamed protein product [Penicillium salamii]|uniref:Uncharacterized protein n=1 Tax=Penicillium salamii TaxID=1612424 RepID=A0A9W4IYE8_9EURO|nr:unnamed protein product [Penicillium salamii]CAG8365716.1 unnamed protein product [Penicillium salamii]CAG8367157.1 unnamed protein product [Penicillium salamii]CAG8382456.1 unnamed protein product [Penicillium salamii]
MRQFELIAFASLDTPLSCEQLKKRCHAAWWRTRRAYPVIGTETDMEQAYFEPHNTAEAAKRWATERCLIATNTSLEEVRQSLIRRPLDKTTMTLVVDPIRGPRGCVYNVSHTLTDLPIYDPLQEFTKQLSRPDAERGIDAIFSPDFLLDITPRLPQSLCHAYSRLFQPTPEDLAGATQILERANARYARSTIGIPLHPDWKTRPSHMHNKTIKFEPAESRSAFRCFKQLGISLTTAFFACMTSAIAQKYSQGNEEGAHLLFSSNGRRWIDLAGDGHGPINMSIVPAGLWINADEADLRAKDKHSLAKLAKAIGHAQEQDLVSPHLISLYDQMAPELVKGMANPNQPDPPALGRPTLTSQGAFGKNVADPAGGDPMRITYFNTGGRNTDPAVCFALNTYRDELKFNLLFDERFFALHEVAQLAQAVAGLFREFVADEEPVRAKL